MGDPRLIYDGKTTRLRSIGKNAFEPKDPSQLLASFDVPSAAVRVLRFQIILVTRNTRGLAGLVQRIRADFMGHELDLLAIDNGSTDGTAKRMKRIGIRVHELTKASDSDHAERVRVLVGAHSKAMTHQILVPIAAPVTPRDATTPGSFSMVATEEVREEALITLRTLRQFHDQPAFVVCDAVTADYLRGAVTNLETNQDAGGANLDAAKAITDDFITGEKKRNSFHRPDAILRKMDAVDWGVRETGSTFFVDADIVAVAPVFERFTAPLWLSPHYHREEGAADSYGLFNAGYLFTSAPDLAEVWRDLYLNRSTFYEQQGMNYLCENFRIGLFGREHNVGFWRGSMPADAKSFHVHLHDRLDPTATGGLRRVYQHHRGEVLELIKKDYPATFEIIQEVIG